MASAIYTDLETRPVNPRVRSLSYASYPGSPTDTPLTASPRVPATPINTPTAECLSPRSLSGSPSLASPQVHSPDNKSDSGHTSPAEKTAPIQFHPPDFIKSHHFYPILWPSAPPNSPENWHIAGAAMNQADEDVPSSLGERLAALNIARPDKENFTNTEVKILKAETPKAPVNAPYEIRAVPGKGYGCFAIKEIKRGTRILADDPLLIIPKAMYYERHVKEAFSKLSPDEQALYFTLHSAHGQDPSNWPKAIHPNLDDEERSRITEQHKARTAKEPSLLSIFQTNCMEMEGGGAVFPNAARFNHSCNPNACFSWNPATRKETIHAMRDIKKDEEITLSYCEISHDKATRARELKHYGFVCNCQACSSDEGDPESFAANSAARRFRMMELEEAFQFTRGPNLGKGLDQAGFVEQLLEYIKLLKEEGDYTTRLGNAYLDIALLSEQKGELQLAKQCALRALKIKLDCQGPDYPDVRNYTGVLQRINKKIAEQSAHTDTK